MVSGSRYGAMVLSVTETWTNADGSTGTAVVSDNVEAERRVRRSLLYQATTRSPAPAG